MIDVKAELLAKTAEANRYLEERRAKWQAKGLSEGEAYFVALAGYTTTRIAALEVEIAVHREEIVKLKAGR